MLQLDNQTPYQAERALLADVDGSEIWVVAVKATFDIRDGKVALAEEQEPVCLADEYFGEPGISSMKYENELAFKKPGTDVILNGHAYAPGGQAVEKLDVAFRVGPVRKQVRVYGDRTWKNALIGFSLSSAEPFVRMPLVYERAFGGTDLSDPDPKKQGAEERNPIGAGFALTKAALIGTPVPNLEDPKAEIKSWKDRPRPSGFGLVAKHWLPRRQYAGTYDQQWMKERLPLYPLDFDYRFFLGAPEDQVAVPHLRGGEPVELTNLTPEGFLSFALPRVFLGFETRLGGEWVPHKALLGTVFLEPDVPRVLIVWQSLLPCHRQKFDLKMTRITEKEVVSWN